jgi:peptidoglycan/xylan/chitin deacetylase (PgdA/CDA1 family)
MDSLNMWPNGCRGAVSVTFDDGNEGQYKLCAPALEARGFRGTFYVTMKADKYREAYQPWIAVAAKGHEIGNHTQNHICSANFQSTPSARGLESCTLVEIEADILGAEAKLRDLVPEQTERTFAYPCYQNWVGRGIHRQSYVPIVARHFAAGKAGGEYGFFNNPMNIDLACAIGVPTERMSGAEMIGLVELAMRRGHWIILTFHQVGAGRLGTSEFDFLNLLDHLAEHKDRIWTAPAVTVAKVIRDYQRTLR